MTVSNICPICDKGTLRSAAYDDTFVFNADPLPVSGLQHSLCDSCEADPIMPDQITFNQILITDAKRRSLNLLTSADIKSLRQQFGLTQKQAAEAFGGGANAFSKYERGEVIQSEAMDKLLRVALMRTEVVNDLAVINNRIASSTGAEINGPEYIIAPNSDAPTRMTESLTISESLVSAAESTNRAYYPQELLENDELDMTSDVAA